VCPCTCGRCKTPCPFEAIPGHGPRDSMGSSSLSLIRCSFKPPRDVSGHSRNVLVGCVKSASRPILTPWIPSIQYLRAPPWSDSQSWGCSTSVRMRDSSIWMGPPVLKLITLYFRRRWTHHSRSVFPVKDICILGDDLLILTIVSSPLTPSSSFPLLLFSVPSRCVVHVSWSTYFSLRMNTPCTS
jgi:hypothetical protein